jgi:RNA polymerase sigma factor (sigma-70 family)
MSDTQSEKQSREKFFSLAGQHLERLYEFVRRRLAYFESLGDLLPGELAAEDVVDAVLLRAYHEYVNLSKASELTPSEVERVNEPAGRVILGWLIELATKRLRSEIKRLKSERNRAVHIEEDIPETPPVEEVSTLGDEILDFYQPDEDLKLEDIFPDGQISTPEEMTAAKEELLRCVNASLAEMPREWRRALRLRHAEGFTDAELADALRKEAPEIERILEYGRQHLRRSLIQSGCTFIARESDDSSSKVVKGHKEND